ncbi:tetratricopeptide repeat protein [Planctopirus hydrillae]|nr:tetratricopeptide repeat protein [Planctopirus hydrillae]
MEHVRKWSLGLTAFRLRRDGGFHLFKFSLMIPCCVAISVVSGHGLADAFLKPVAAQEVVTPPPVSEEATRKTAASEETQPAGSPKVPAGPVIQLQPLDEPAVPLTPKTPRTPAEEKQAEALAWFMSGSLFESRLEWKRAYTAYQRAAELDPGSAETYRKLMQIALIQEQPAQAMSWAMKVVDLDPADFEVLHTLAAGMAAQQKGAEAIKFLEQAANSPTLDPLSNWAIRLQRDLAILYLATGDIPKAADKYELLLKVFKKPDEFKLDPRFRNELMNDPRTGAERVAQVLLDAERVAPAREALELAVKTGKASRGNVNFYQAKLLLLEGKPAEALVELQKYIDAQRQSKGREAYELLSQILSRSGLEGELIDRLTAIAEKDQRNSTLQFFLAEKLTDRGDYEKAEKIYEASLKGSRDLKGYLGLSRLYRKQKVADKLLDTLGRGLSQAPPDGVDEIEAEFESVAKDRELVGLVIDAGRRQATAEPRELTFEEAYLVAKLASQGEQIDAAIEFFRKAKEIAPDRGGIVLSDLAEMLLKADRYADAAQVLEEALEEPAMADRKPNLLFQLSQAREMNGNTEGALEAIDQAIRLIPQAAVLQFQKGWIYYHSRNFEKAIAQFETVLRDFPGETRIVRQCQFSLSNIYVMQGDIPRGEAILEKVLEEDPEDISVNNDLGYLYADQGKNLEKAEKMIRKAVAAEPENAAYLDSLGWVLFKLGKYEEALSPLEKAAEMRTGGDGTIYEHLGDAYDKLGRAADAQKAWAKAMEKSRAERLPDEKLLKRLEEKLGTAAKPKEEAKPQGSKQEGAKPEGGKPQGVEPTS